MTANDFDLLRQFARDHAQDAFTALVKRHVNLVYSAALRQVRSPQLAEEVAQSVFTDLAHNAANLTDATTATPVLAAWLYTVTRRTAVDVIRKESRRQLREQIAVELNTMNATANDWAQVEPLLDDAMDALDQTDRTAILLRYFENKNLREVGAALGTNDDAAQKRVSRAVEQLREFLARRGATVGAGALTVVISANAVQAAPAALAAAISTAALAGATVTTSSAVIAAKTIAMTALQKTVITAAFVAIAGAGIYQTIQATRLRQENVNLRQTRAPLASQIELLMQERDDATNRISELAVEVSQLRSNSSSSELLRLRGQVGVLEQQLASLDQARPAVASPAEALAVAGAPAPALRLKKTYSSFDLPAEHPDMKTNVSGTISLTSVDLLQALDLYRGFSKRAVIHGALPDVKISLNARPASVMQALQLFDTAFAENNIAMVISGDTTVKAVVVSQLAHESLPEIDLPADELPDSSSPMTRTVQLKNVRVATIIPALAPLAGLPHSLMAIQDQNVLVIRDYSANIKQQLKLIETLDQKPSR